MKLHSKYSCGVFPVGFYVESFCILGIVLTQGLRELNISYLKSKPQQRLYFLWKLKKFNMTKTITFIQMSLSPSSPLSSPHGMLQPQRLDWTAEDHPLCQEGDQLHLPSLIDLYTCRYTRQVVKIMADPSHPDTNCSPLAGGHCQSRP